MIRLSRIIEASQPKTSIPKFDVGLYKTGQWTATGRAAVAELMKYLQSGKLSKIDCEEFDFPEYGGLPKKISNRLSGDEVDAITSWLYDVSRKYMSWSKK